MASALDEFTECDWYLQRIGSYIKDFRIKLNQKEIIIGRGRNRGIEYSIGVSRKHALIKKTVNGHWKIKDLCSMNGLYINSRKITAGCFKRIEEFDIIGLGVAKATRNEYFSFMLCRRPKQEQSSEGFVEKEPKQYPKETSNAATVYPVKSMQNKGERVLFRKRSYKWKEMTIPSDDTDNSDDEIVPRKNYKQRKRKPLIISSDESDNNYEAELSNTFNETNKETNNFISQRNCLSNAKLQRNQFSHLKKRSLNSSAQPNQQSLKSYPSTNITTTHISQGMKLDLNYDCAIQDFYSAIDSVKTSNKNVCSDEEGERFPKPALNVSNLDSNMTQDNKKPVCLQVPSIVMTSDDRDLVAVKQEQNHFVKIKKQSKPVYSQVPDVIIISDDEDLVVVKQEQNEFVETKKKSINGHIKKLKEISLDQKCKIDQSITQQRDAYNTDVKIEINCSDDEMTICDTMNDFFDFGIDDDKLRDRIVWPTEQDDWNKENNSFPQLSQASDVHRDHMDTKVNKENTKECNQTKSKIKDVPSTQIKSVSGKPRSNGIRLMEALPICYRPRHTRGREEWFIERTSKAAPNDTTINKITTQNTEISLETSIEKIQKNTLRKKQSSNTGGSRSDKNKSSPSLKQKLKKTAGYRMRHPGGGSAIRKKDTSTGLGIVSSITAIKGKHKTPWSDIMKETTKGLPLGSNNIHHSNKPKPTPNPSVQRFASRTEQLIKSMLSSDSSIKPIPMRK